MKTTTSLAVLAQAFLVAAQENPIDSRAFGGRRGGGDGGYGGFGGGPFGKGGSGCARDCVSEYWETAEPTPTAFCESGSQLESCISSACADEGDEYESYADRSSSLCSEFLSCESTGTYTYTHKTPDGDWPFGGRGGGRGGDDKSWPTGEVVVTGCPWNGDGWGFPFWGGLGYGDNFWDEVATGWDRETVTTTVSAESMSAVVTIEQAVSGDQSTFRTIGLQAAETGGSETNGGESGASSVLGDHEAVKAVGIALAAVVAMVGLL